MSGIVAYRSLKLSLYHLCRGIGLFRLSRRLTRRGLRILCYHGFEVLDESGFLPRTFISRRTFEQRLAFLGAARFPVLRLGAALELLKAGTLPPCATVITIDDGFSSTHTFARPALLRHSYPATIYVTTYYSMKERPIFRLAVQYLFWKGHSVKCLEMADISASSSRVVSLSLPEDRRAIMWEIIHHGEDSCTEEQRARILSTLGARLGVNIEPIISFKVFHLITLAEAALMHRDGLDIQLHTHRHCFPPDEARAKREIEENRAALGSSISKRFEHFCYPSGIWAKEQWPWLGDMGMKSAVTCETGLNFADSPPFALGRFIDGEDISMIEFEAELMGFAELMRKIRGALTWGRQHRSRAGSARGGSPEGVSA